MSSSQVLVTGGAGFIGSALVRGALDAGHAVRVIDDLSTGFRKNLEGVEDQIEFVHGSILLEEPLGRAMDGADVVLHHAAVASVARSVSDPMGTHEADATGTLKVLVAARDAGVRRVVYAGSSAAYGASTALPSHEGQVPMPRSPYAVAKLAGEHYCQAFTETFGLATVSLRYFNVFGPRQDPSSDYAAVIPRFARAMLQGDQPVIFGDGLQTRDFVFVDNVVHANLVAMTAGPDAFGRVFNIGQGQRYSLLDLVDRLAAIIDVGDVAPVFEPERRGDIKHSQADIGGARAVLGYEPSVSFDEGLRQTVDWIEDTDNPANL
jgi:UDP-glucose 4-epimerase